jgi:tetratricopeptide (TPR) repeat protein
MLGNRGGLAFRQGKYEEAAVIHEEALARKRAIGDRLAIAHSAGDLALAEIELGHDELAGRLLKEALEIFSEAGQMFAVAEAVEALARIAQGRRDLYRAARLYSGAATLRAEIGVTHHPADLPRYQAALDSLRNTMGSSAFEAAWTIGQATSTSRILEEVAAGGIQPSIGDLVQTVNGAGR